ncbi:hypothetical protein CTheo_8193 [Ceratobasidium theobromae]|uniref:T6SS Phospholipase effector Tle1-like catalytic domain-containing protein n=1 Tax=Ceratobasidium theobromae TaxID=1582974 RepID=A0A5N5QAE0_9AGAM|nr:hypothetical protein CTheo_8193 [Ceratobasidium theobromae]
MSAVSSNGRAESPTPLTESDRRPPRLPLLNQSFNRRSVDAGTLMDSPASSSFGHLTPPGVPLHGSMSTPDIPGGVRRQPLPPHPHRESSANFPQVIPPAHANRTLVLCFDGTGDQFDQDNSNIVQFFQLLKKDDRNKQMVYYQAGIGTSSKHFVTPVGIALSKAADMAIAHGLKDHICLFGFSRGAYTARALAGMLHKVGLLPPFNYQQVPFAYHMYQRDDKEGWEMSNGFKLAFSIDVEIHFMGLFDTVNSVDEGLIPRELPFAKSNYVVRTFRHAVALDERRAKFKANLWGRTSDEDAALAAPNRAEYLTKKKREKLKRMSEEQKRATLYGYSSSMIGSAVGSVTGAVGTVAGAVGSVGGYVASSVGAIVGYGAAATNDTHAKRQRIVEGSGVYPPDYTFDVDSQRLDDHMKERNGQIDGQKKKKHHRGKDNEWKVAYAIGGKLVERTETDVEEVWFTGAHTDVGGGSVKNGERYSLARISLRWMVRQCFKCNTGIMFHSNLLEDIGLSPETLWPEVLPRPPPLMSLTDIPRSIPSTPTLSTRQSEPHLPAYSRLPASTNDPKFNADHPGYADAVVLDINDPRNPNAEKYTPYSQITDREHTQLSHRVDPCEPYIPLFGRKFGHELRDFGPGARVEREPFISEEVEDLKDALSPIYDQLTLNWWWWILELLPMKHVWRKKDRSWRRFFSINLGGPRVIKNQKRNGVNVHRTVQIRLMNKKDLEGEPLNYSPRTHLKMARVRWMGGAEKPATDATTAKD